MIIALIIISFIGLVYFICKLIKSIEYDKQIYILLYSISLIGVFCFSIMAITSDIPSAIDVYRGKTDLKIIKTIEGKNVTECDSIVIWKQ